MTRLKLLLSAFAIAGCANPAQTYVGGHPTLTPAQQQILTSHEVPNGTAVAGMTHEEINLAMNGYPISFDKIGGEEAWVYVRKKSGLKGITDSSQKAAGPSGGRPIDLNDSAPPEPPVNIRTIVFFQGDRATHATVTREPL